MDSVLIPPLDPVLNHLTAFSTFTPSFFKIRFNNIRNISLDLPNGLFPSGFLTKI